jgi:hypothetical protein
MSGDGTERRRELQRRAGFALLDAAPDGWLRIDLRCRALPDMQETTLTVLLTDGSYPSIAIPREAVDALIELRELMYEPGEGTWFSVRCLIDAPGRQRISYNMDWNPGWESSIKPASWMRDLEVFPRDPAHLPEWLRDQLGQAPPPEPDSARVESGGLDPYGQNEIWSKITNIVLHFRPTDSAHIMLTYRAIGDHTELVVMIRRISDGGLYRWAPPAEVVELLARLRAGMYREGRGTWFQAAAQISIEARWEYTYTWDDQPAWDAAVPAGAFAREQRLFPRDADRTPGWMRALIPLGAADQDALRQAEEAAAELGLDSARFGIGEVVDGAWCLTNEGERWAVFQRQGQHRLEPIEFATARQAVRYFVGHLYLNRVALGDELPPEARRPAGRWPIQPLGQDIGLNLYKGKRLVTLPPGTELDRYGDQTGNTLYAAGTQFPYRSQKAEKKQQPYRVYRLRYAVRALTGTTVAWFGQPGGGVAFLLERPIADLLADNVLEEIPHPTVAPPCHP